MQIHVVQRGQTLSGIAKAYETTVEDIVRANKLPNPDRLVVGQALVIPIVGRFIGCNPETVYGRLPAGFPFRCSVSRK